MSNYAEAANNNNNEKPPSYYCQRCKNHGLLILRKRHQIRCPFKTCSCQLCLLIDQRRVVMRTRNQISVMDGLPKYAQQMGILAEKRKSSCESSDSDGKKIRKPRCFLCTGHGKDSELKNHKKAGCPFENCHCDTCTLGRQYRRLMAVQTKQRRYQSKDEKGISEATSSEQSSRSGSMSSEDKPFLKLKKPCDEDTSGNLDLSIHKRHKSDNSNSNLSPFSPPKQSFLIDDILSKTRVRHIDNTNCLNTIVQRLVEEVDEESSMINREAQSDEMEYCRYVQNWQNNFSSQLLLLVAKQCIRDNNDEDINDDDAQPIDMRVNH